MTLSNTRRCAPWGDKLRTLGGKVRQPFQQPQGIVPDRCMITAVVKKLRSFHCEHSFVGRFANMRYATKRDSSTTPLQGLNENQTNGVEILPEVELLSSSAVPLLGDIFTLGQWGGFGNGIMFIQ